MGVLFPFPYGRWGGGEDNAAAASAASSFATSTSIARRGRTGRERAVVVVVVVVVVVAVVVVVSPWAAIAMDGGEVVVVFIIFSPFSSFPLFVYVSNITCVSELSIMVEDVLSSMALSYCILSLFGRRWDSFYSRECLWRY
jgi:hypothetical protein